mgnify:CR=1 FL=1
MNQKYHVYITITLEDTYTGWIMKCWPTYDDNNEWSRKASKLKECLGVRLHIALDSKALRTSKCIVYRYMV